MSTWDSDPGRSDQVPKPEDVLAYIRQALESLRFGALEITVHEGRIVQIERKEKHRFVSSRTRKD